MNYYEEMNYPNLPTLKEIIEKYDKDTQVEFLDSKLQISAKENVFFAIRRKYSILAQDCELISDLSKGDESSFELAMEITESMINFVDCSPKRYSDSYLPQYLNSIQTEVSKDAISINCLDIDFRWIESFINRADLFWPLREQLFILVSTVSMICKELSSMFSDSAEDEEDDMDNYINSLKSMLHKDYFKLIEAIKEGVIEGVSNFAFLLFTLLEKNHEQDIADCVPRFTPALSPALHMGEERKEKAKSISNNAGTLELDRQSKLKLYFEMIDLNPVDKRYYPGIAAVFPDFIESICSTCSFFAVPFRLNAIIENLSKNSEYSVDELENSIMRIRNVFDIPDNILTGFREKYRANVLARIDAKATSLSNNKGATMNAAVSVLDQINTQLQNSKISLQGTDVLSKIEAALNNILNDYTSKMVNSTSDSYESCIKKLDKEKEKLKLNGSAVVSVDAGYSIVLSIFKNKLANYANTLGAGEKNISECMDLLKQKSDELKMPFDYDVSEAMKLLLTNNAVNYIMGFIQQNLGQSEEDAKKCLEIAAQKCKAIELSDESTKLALAPARRRLMDIDLHYRTVNGTVTSSREEAAILRNLDSQNTECYFKGDYLFKIQSIKAANISEPIKNERLSVLQRKMQEFDEKCRKAARYQHFLQTKNRFWNGDSKDMGIHYGILIALVLFSIYRITTSRETDMLITGIFVCACYCGYLFGFKPTKEKKIWEEITLNGKNRFDDVINEQKRSFSTKT